MTEDRLPEEQLRHLFQEPIMPLNIPEGRFEEIQSASRHRRRSRQRQGWLSAGAAAAVAAVAVFLVVDGDASRGVEPLDGVPPAASVTTNAAQSPTTTTSTSETAERPSAPSEPAPSAQSASSTGSAPSQSGGIVLPDGGPVPPSFAPVSVTTTREALYVLGDAPCSRRPCTSLVRSVDGGATWVGLPAPLVELAPPAAAGRSLQARTDTVHDLRFATGGDGWAFGGALWSTHDGSRRTESWNRVNLGGRAVLDLATNGRSVFALVADCSTDGTSCRDAQLLASGVDRDDFAPVDGVAAEGRVSGAEVALAGSSGTVRIEVSGGTDVFRYDGQTWRSVSAPCDRPATAVEPTATGSELVAFCGEPAAGSVYLTTYVSTDGGREWTRRGDRLQLSNGRLSFAAASTEVMAAASGSVDLRGALRVTRDGGASWTSADVPEQPQGWRYVGASGGDDFIAVPFASTGAVWTSSDGGRSWQAHEVE